MPKIRLRRRQSNSHPEYMNEHDLSWVERQREQNGGQFRKSLVRVIGLCVVLVVLLILALTTTLFGRSSASGNVNISAADTYAVSGQTQKEMQATAQDFITGMILFSYCSDQDVAEQGKEAAMACLATGSDTYDLIDAMQFAGEGAVGPDDISVVVGGLGITSGTRSYEGTYVIEGRGSAADLSKKDDDHPDGTLVDRGYYFTLSFSQVTDENGENPVWRITNAQIQRA